MIVSIGLIINALSFLISDEYFSSYLLVKLNLDSVQTFSSFLIALSFGGGIFFLLGVIAIYLMRFFKVSVSRTTNILIPTVFLLLFLVFIFFYKLMISLSDWGGLNIGGYTDDVLLYNRLKNIKDIPSFFIVKGIQSYVLITFLISLIISITFVKNRRVRK